MRQQAKPQWDTQLKAQKDHYKQQILDNKHLNTLAALKVRLEIMLQYP